MKDEVKYSMEKFKRAFERLREGVGRANDELTRDGVIQRFEFTFELLWKTLKIFLEREGIQAKTPRDCFKETFKLGWLDNEEIYLNMLMDRNKLSHLYQQSESEKIFQRIKNEYLSCLAVLLQKLELKSPDKNRPV